VHVDDRFALLRGGRGQRAGKNYYCRQRFHERGVCHWAQKCRKSR
jgi:hypothetical protein